MRLPDDPHCNDCDQSVYSAANGVNHDMLVEPTVVLQLPTTEELDDDDNQQDIDYLSLASGHAAADHNVMTTTGRPVPASLIDRVMASPEQTYEQLLASFMYLTAGLYNLSIFSLLPLSLSLNVLCIVIVSSDSLSCVVQ